MDGARKAELGAWLAGLAEAGAAVIVATHDVEFAATVATRVVLLGDGVLIADGAVDEILSGGWYFATEVARILGATGAVTPAQGAAILASVRGRLIPDPAVADAKRSSRGSYSV
jgi:energy-coupling factor transport system ATP-binding protein